MNFSEILSHTDIDVFEKVDLTGLTTLRLVSHGNYAHVKSIDGLSYALKALIKNQKKYVLLGWGSNTLMPEDASKMIFLKLQLSEEVSLRELENLKDAYRLPASLSVTSLIKAAKNLGLSGWEVLTGIPASLGGAIVMNAGTKFGEIASITESVEVMGRNGEVRTIAIDPKVHFGYRKNLFLEEGEVVIYATLKHFGQDVSGVNQKIDEYLQYRKSTQPLASKNCGCVFKNPLPEHAGKLIEELGLKGHQEGDLKISERHANFIENKGRATYSDFIKLTEYINARLKAQKGIELELEVQKPK